MGKKGLTSIFSKLVDSGGPVAVDDQGSAPSPPWPWPSCRNPQTASFREDDRVCSTTADAAAAVRRSPAAAARLRGGAGEMFKTANSVYQMEYCSVDGSCFDEEEGEEERVVVVEDDDGFSTTTASEEWSEAVIRSLGRTSTDRFFVESGPESNSILALSPEKPAPAPAESLVEESVAVAVQVSEEAPPSEPSSTTSLVEESVAVAVDSEDPYRDFRASMEEMVAAHGLRGWEALEELLVWYLRINGKHNHALIVGAFVDLIVGLATPPPPPASASAAPTTTTTTTMTTTSRSSAGSTASTSTSSSTCGGGDATPATATAEQCGGGNDASRCSSSSSDQEETFLPDEATGAGDGNSERNMRKTQSVF